MIFISDFDIVESDKIQMKFNNWLNDVGITPVRPPYICWSKHSSIIKFPIFTRVCLYLVFTNWAVAC